MNATTTASFLASGVERRAHVHMPSKWALLQPIQYGARGNHISEKV
jgi:hypothetical protein